jgi:hypothetical protein
MKPNQTARIAPGEASPARATALRMSTMSSCCPRQSHYKPRSQTDHLPLTLVNREYYVSSKVVMIHHQLTRLAGRLELRPNTGSRRNDDSLRRAAHNRLFTMTDHATHEQTNKHLLDLQSTSHDFYLIVMLDPLLRQPADHPYPTDLP